MAAQQSATLGLFAAGAGSEKCKGTSPAASLRNGSSGAALQRGEEAGGGFVCSACRRPRHACGGGWAGKQFLPRGSNGWGRGVERSLLQTPAPGHTACWEKGVGSELKARFLLEATSTVKGRRWGKRKKGRESLRRGESEGFSTPGEGLSWLRTISS